MRNNIGYSILLAFLTTVATGLATALVSRVTDGSIAQFFGGLTIRQIQSAETQWDDDAEKGQPPRQPPKPAYRCKNNRLLISCFAYLEPSGSALCDASVREDDQGGKCVVGACNGVKDQWWRVSLTCLKR